jgi:hypothetical protein
MRETDEMSRMAVTAADSSETYICWNHEPEETPFFRVDGWITQKAQRPLEGRSGLVWSGLDLLIGLQKSEVSYDEMG